MIGFRVPEFWQTFHLNATRVAGKPLAILADYARYTLRILQWPLIIIPLVLLMAALFKPWNCSVSLAVFIRSFVIAIFIGIGRGSIWWAILMMFILAASFAKNHPRAQVVALQVVMALALLVANRRLFVNCYGLLSGNIVTAAKEELQPVAALFVPRPSIRWPWMVTWRVMRMAIACHRGCWTWNFARRIPAVFPAS